MRKAISLFLLLSISATLAACSSVGFYQAQSPAPEDVVTHKDR
jgi:predicted small lipoprotein YifL